MKGIITLLLGLALCVFSFAQAPNAGADHNAATAPDDTERCACCAPVIPKTPSPLGENPYWIFIGFLYACVAADIAGRFAKVYYRWSRYEESKREHWWIPVFSHLVLASFVVGTSWMAWSKAFAVRHVTSPNGVISVQAVLVIVDFVILVMYFALVSVVGNVRESGKNPELRAPARKHSSYWIAWILSVYVVWDFFTYFIVPLSNKCGSCFWAHSWMSLFCTALGWLAFAWLRRVRIDRPLWMLAGDASLLGLILFYRALKEYSDHPEGLEVVAIVTFATFVLFGWLAGKVGLNPPSTPPLSCRPAGTKHAS